MKNIDIKQFQFSYPIFIRWNDLDPIGHVNNVMYFDYFQTGRGFYMLEASKNWDWKKNMFVIAHIECDYFSELKMEFQNPKIWVRTTKIGNKSFDFEYLITTENNGETVIHSRGKSVQVLVDLAIGKSIEIPDWLREDIQKYESD